MAFDYLQARKDGYTVKEISDYLKKTGRNFNLEAAINDVYSDKEINDYLTKTSSVKKEAKTTPFQEPEMQPFEGDEELSTNDINENKAAILKRKLELEQEKIQNENTFGFTERAKRENKPIGEFIFDVKTLGANILGSLGVENETIKKIQKQDKEYQDIKNQYLNLSDAIEDNKKYIPAAEEKFGKSLIELTPQEYAETKKQLIDPNYKEGESKSNVGAARVKQLQDDYSSYVKALNSKIAINDNILKDEGFYKNLQSTVNELKNLETILNKPETASNKEIYKNVYNGYLTKYNEYQNLISDPRYNSILQVEQKKKQLQSEFDKDIKKTVSDIKGYEVNQDELDKLFEENPNWQIIKNAIGKAGAKIVAGTLKLPKSLGDVVTTKELPIIGQLDDYLYNVGTATEMASERNLGSATKMMRNISQKYADYKGYRFLVDDDNKAYSVRNTDFGKAITPDEGKLIEEFNNLKEKPKIEKDFSGQSLFQQSADVLADIGALALSGRGVSAGLGKLTKLKDATRANIAGTAAIYTQTYGDFYKSLAQDDNLTESEKNRYAMANGLALSLVSQYFGGFEKSLSNPNFKSKLIGDISKYKNQLINGEVSATQVAYNATKKLLGTTAKNIAEEEMEEVVLEPLEQMAIDKVHNAITNRNSYNVPGVEETKNTIIATALPVAATNVVQNPYTKNAQVKALLTDLQEKISDKNYEDVGQYYSDLIGLNRTPSSDNAINAIKLAEKYGKGDNSTLIDLLFRGSELSASLNKSTNEIEKSNLREKLSKVEASAKKILNGEEVSFYTNKDKPETEEVVVEKPTEVIEEQVSPAEVVVTAQPIEVTTDEVFAQVQPPKEYEEWWGTDPDAKKEAVTIIDKINSGAELSQTEIEFSNLFKLEDAILNAKNLKQNEKAEASSVGVGGDVMPKEISDLYSEAASLRFTLNALKQQMGGKTLVGKAKTEYENTKTRLDNIELKLSEYEKNKSNVVKATDKEQVIDKSIVDDTIDSVDSEYGNFLLNEIDKRHKEKYNGENIKSGLAKQFNETLADRGENRAISNLEDVYMNYVPTEVRADAYQALRKNFEKEQSLKETPQAGSVVGGEKSILNSDTNLKGAKETVLKNGVESTQIDKPNNINVEDNSQRWWIYHNAITGEKIIHSEYGWDYDLDGNRLSVDYNKKVLDNNSLFKKEEPKSNLLDAILKKERGWEARVTESKDLAQLESIEKELQTNEKLKQAFGFNGKVYDQTGKDFYSRLNYLRSHPEKVVSENVSVKEPLVNEKLRTAISDGRMTATDAKKIIESAGLEVPKDIVEQSLKETPTISKTEAITTAEGKPKQEQALIEEGKKEVTDLKSGKTTIKNPIKIFKGLFGKRNIDGTIRTAHPDVIGTFGSIDEKIAEKYAGEQKEMTTFDIPAGTTLEVIKVQNPKKGMSILRQEETDLVNNSDAQVVKLITVDTSGTYEDQYIIRDKNLLKPSNIAITTKTSTNENERNQRDKEAEAVRSKKLLEEKGQEPQAETAPISITKKPKYDKENVTRIPSEEPKREEPIKAEPDQKRGRKEAGPSRDVQGDEQEKVIEEIKSKNLTHVIGLNMMPDQAQGMYISTEEKNRYETKDKKAIKVQVAIKKPLLVTEDPALIGLRTKILNDNRSKFTKEDSANYTNLPDGKITLDDLSDRGTLKLAKLTTEYLKSKGYDSIYFRESKNQEGELIVFDINKVSVSKKGKALIKRKAPNFKINNKYQKLFNEAQTLLAGDIEAKALIFFLQGDKLSIESIAEWTSTKKGSKERNKLNFLFGNSKNGTKIDDFIRELTEDEGSGFYGKDQKDLIMSFIDVLDSYSTKKLMAERLEAKLDAFNPKIDEDFVDDMEIDQFTEEELKLADREDIIEDDNILPENISDEEYEKLEKYLNELEKNGEYKFEQQEESSGESKIISTKKRQSDRISELDAKIKERKNKISSLESKLTKAKESLSKSFEKEQIDMFGKNKSQELFNDKAQRNEIIKDIQKQLDIEKEELKKDTDLLFELKNKNENLDIPFKIGQEKATTEQKAQTQKIIDFFNQGMKTSLFAPLTEFNSKLKELGYDSLKAMVEANKQIKFVKTPQGQVLGFVSDGKIYLNPDALSPETTFHELAHVQQELLSQAAEKGDKNAKAILDRFKELLKDPIANISKNRIVEIGGVKIDLSSEVYNQGENESDADYEKRMMYELWAYLQAPENVKKWEEASAKGNTGAKGVLDLINQVIEWFKEKLGIKGMTLDQIRNATLEQLIENSSNSLMKKEYFDLKQEEKPTGEETKKVPQFQSFESKKAEIERKKAEEAKSKGGEIVKSKFAEALENDERFGEVFVSALKNATFNRKKDKEVIEAVSNFIKENGAKEAAQKILNGTSNLSLDEQSLATHSLLVMLREQGEKQLLENLADNLLSDATNMGRAIRQLGSLKSLTEQEFLGWVERKFAKSRKENEGLINQEVESLKSQINDLKSKLAEEALKKVGEKAVTKDNKEGILRRRTNYINSIKEYFKNKTKVGFAKDFEQEARNDIKLLKDLVGLVYTYLEEGIVKISDISTKLKNELGIENNLSEAFTKEIFDKAREKQLVKKINKAISPETLSKIIKSTNLDENYIENLSKKLQAEGLSEIDSKTIAEEVKTLISDKILKLVSPKRGKMSNERKKELASQKETLVQNLFNLNRDAASEYAKEKLGIPTLTDEDYKKLKELRKAYVESENNTQEQADRFYDMTSFIITRTDKFSSYITLQSLMYFNMLSGIFTHVKNILSNTVSILANLPVVYGTGLLRGDKRNYIFNELKDGILGDLKEGAKVLKTGYSSVKRGEDLSLSAISTVDAYLKYGDINKFDKGVLSASSFVGRLLKAADTVFYMMQYRVMAAVKANEIAKQEGLKGQEYKNRVKEIVNDNTINETAKEVALRATFNNNPYGTFGIIYSLIEKNKVWEGGKKRKFVKTAVLPFVRVPLNVLNEKLNWSPIGIGRALSKGNNLFATKDEFIANIPFKDNEIRRQTLSKGLIGTAVMFALILANQSDDDDDDFYITSFLDSDREKRNQLIKEGLKPNSIKIGNINIPYDYFGQSMPLFVSGVIRDYNVHEDKREDDTLLQKLQFLVSQSAIEYYSQAGLDNLSTLMKAFSSDTIDKGKMKALQNMVARTAATATIGNNLVMQIQKLIWDDQYSSDDIQSAYLRNTPLYILNDKKYNSLGGETKNTTPIGSLINSNDDTKVYKIFNRKNYLLQSQNANTILSEDDDNKITFKDLTEDQKNKINKYRGSYIKDQVLKDYKSLEKMDEPEFKEYMSNLSDETTQIIKDKFSKINKEK